MCDELEKLCLPPELPAEMPTSYRRNFLREELAQRRHKSRRILRLGAAARVLGISEATLRDIRFHALTRYSAGGQMIEGNGFGLAFLALGRAVYVDMAKFEEIWRANQSNGGVNV